jgi:hypothetical protein
MQRKVSEDPGFNDFRGTTEALQIGAHGTEPTEDRRRPAEAECS